MKKLSILLAMGLLLGLLPGCNAGGETPAITTPDASPTEGTIPEETMPDQTTPAPITPEKPKDFHLNSF